MIDEEVATHIIKDVKQEIKDGSCKLNYERPNLKLFNNDNPSLKSKENLKELDYSICKYMIKI